MIRYRVILTAILLLGSIEAKQNPDPAKLVARAVSLVVGCDYKIHGVDEERGKRKEVELSQEEKNLQSQTTIPTIFRPGRFVYTSIWDEKYNGAEVWTVAFEPAKSGQPKELPGEDERMNRAMNNMSGRLHIDKNTGGIVHLETWLTSSMDFVGQVKVLFFEASLNVTIRGANMKFDQRLENGKWVPQTATLDVYAVGHLLLDIPWHKHKDISFACKK